MRRLKPDTVLSLDDKAVPLRRRRLPPRWWRPLLRGVKVTLALVIGAGLPAWAWHSGAAAEAGIMLSDATIRGSAQAGLTVQDVLVQGRERTRASDLLAALQIQRGDPILGLDLVAAKERVEALPWVKQASVQRRLPGEIMLHISERAPIALWQNQGEFILVDADGTPIPDTIAGFTGLPLVVGEDAPQNAAALIDMLAAEPDLAGRVKAAVRVSGRRWNLVMDRLDGGVDVRLPEENPRGALARLARLEREQRLLERSISVVDLRLPDRLVVRRAGSPAEPQPAKRKPAGKDA